MAYIEWWNRSGPATLGERFGLNGIKRVALAKGTPGGWYGDWKLNYEDQMSFEEYKQDLDIDKNPTWLEKAEGGRINKKPGGIVEPGVMHYGRKDFNEKELLKGAEFHEEESFDAADRKTKDRIEKQLERHEGKWVDPQVKFQGGAEADWLDAVANKIIDYNDTKDPKEFISRTERRVGQTVRSEALEGFLDQNQALKFANATSKQIEWLSERSGVSKTIIKNAQTKYNAIPNSERRNFSLTENQLKWQLERVDLQKKILERVNQGDTSIKQIAKNLKLSVAKVDAAAGRLYNNIYAEKLKINSPNLNPTSVYLPKTREGLNGILETLWEVDGFAGPEGRTWFKLIRDAKESDRITEEQFKTATGNVRNFFPNEK